MIEKFFNSFNEKLALSKKIEEVHKSGPKDTSFVGGQLEYNDFILREYKVGASLRFFAVWIGEKLCICMIGNHKGKDYHGITYDGKNTFPVKYDNKAYNPDQIEINNQKLVVAAWGLNTMNSPSPVYD